MDKDRFLLAIVVSGAILLSWEFLVMSRYRPKPGAKPPVAAAGKTGEKPGPVDPLKTPLEKRSTPEATPGTGAAPNTVAANPGSPTGTSVTATTPPAKSDATGGAGAPAKTEDKGAGKLQAPSHPQRVIKLGSLDRGQTPYRLQVTLDSRGATISQMTLNDRLYRQSEPPYGPLNLLGHSKSGLRTLETSIPVLDDQFTKISPVVNCRELNWEVVPGSETETAVAFRLKSPDGKWEATKTFELKPAGQGGQGLIDEGTGYHLAFTMTLKNLGDAPQKGAYKLVGPVGMPLEHQHSSREFRTVVVGFDQGNHVVNAKTIVAKEIHDQELKEDGKKEVWQEPIRYVGVNVQYFTALLLPQTNQRESSYLKSVQPILAAENATEPQKSDVSVVLTSLDAELSPAGKPGAEISHQYLLFAGPKRPEFLRPIDAESILVYGMSGGIGVPQTMLKLLNFFHNLFPRWAWPWGWSIILLTVLVRVCMIPLSLRQTKSAARMQELQPEIAALKVKYAKDPEKLGRAQMELFRKNNYNPFGGCLLVFIQLPIFIGLYQSLSISVDLRMAEFLWIKNLAAPDALFRFPFELPFHMGNTFNLLPILSMFLFMAQQKMMMPPPTDKEQEMQQSMMKFMTVFMAFMLYTVPAGLSVYFISSSLWGLAERKLLPKTVKPTTDPQTTNGNAAAASGKNRK